MKQPHRDLLVLIKDESQIPHSIDVEVEMLHEMLFHIETIDNLCTASEVIDLNKFKIISKHSAITRILKQRDLKPFQFVNNKN